MTHYPFPGSAALWTPGVQVRRSAPVKVRLKWADTAPTVVASGTPANDVLRA